MIISFHKLLILRHVSTLETRHVVTGRHRYTSRRDGNIHDERMTRRKMSFDVNACDLFYGNDHSVPYQCLGNLLDFYHCRYARR